YTEVIQVMQLYDLKTMQIQQIFNIYEGTNHPIKYSNSVLAISKNKQMIAFSSGYGNIALYLIENGLEIIRKDLGKDTKIIGCEFKDDNKLMIIKQDKYMVMSIWHLYTNEVQNDKQITLESSLYFYNARIPGKNLVVTESDEIISIYDHILKIDNKTKENQSFLPELELYKDGHKEKTVKILEYNNKVLSKEVALPIIRNREPWITDDYKKKWIYFDQEESIQLYIGKCTVQVWRKIEQKENFILEYFWTNEDDDNGILQIDLMRHACIGIEYLNDQRNKFVGYENQHVKYTNLHILRITRWTESKNNSNKSDLQIAIRLCKPGLERNRKILVVTYLLEYYLKNATEHHGWLITISKAIPDLYSYNLEFCIPEIFYKKCMEGIEVSDIPVHKDIIKNFNIAKYKFIAFNSISKPISTRCYLLVVEYRQFNHLGWRHYFNLFNFVDLASIIIAVIVMSVYVTPSFDTKKAFANVITTQEITIAISFTMLLLWFEFVCIS
ncbi:6864_t:CDS:2, partial [Funneliformis caledonium]